MNELILEKAYEYGSQAFEKAAEEAYLKLSNDFQELDRNTLFEASEKGINLHFQAYQLGFKIHGNMLSIEKALVVLGKQSPGFPKQIYEKALQGAYVETR
ncbi:MAG: hypothetical protein V3R49_00530 [Gammaproteobacteria bacterium]